jgi:hypothetical protein
MKPQFRRVIIGGMAAVLAVQTVAQAASLWDTLGLGKKDASDSATLTSGLNTLSQDQVVQGLKEALGKGVQQAISKLGHDGGFLTNLEVKIPMPEKLHTVEKALRAVHEEKLADDFINTMNHAAEQAVPQAAEVFADAIKTMSIEDAKGILVGTNNAATQFFRSRTETNLFERFLPIVKKATDQTGVTSAYKQVLAKAEGGGALGALGSFGRSLLAPETVDVDAYVTNKALDGLFKMVADEEKRIRENPVARTTDLLKQVFGAVSH